jgi:hypothetical protein
MARYDFTEICQGGTNFNTNHAGITCSMRTTIMVDLLTNKWPDCVDIVARNRGVTWLSTTLNDVDTLPHPGKRIGGGSPKHNGPSNKVAPGEKTGRDRTTRPAVRLSA